MDGEGSDSNRNNQRDLNEQLMEEASNPPPPHDNNDPSPSTSTTINLGFSHFANGPSAFEGLASTAPHAGNQRLEEMLSRARANYSNEMDRALASWQLSYTASSSSTDQQEASLHTPPPTPAGYYNILGSGSSVLADMPSSSGYHHDQYPPIIRTPMLVVESSRGAEIRTRNEEIMRGGMEGLLMQGFTIYHLSMDGRPHQNDESEEEEEEEEGDEEFDGMSINVDEMTYEELLELENENGGDVETGLSEEVILAHLMPHIYYKLDESAENDICAICQEEFENGQVQGRLACGHSYHYECIKRWLAVKNDCPICKRQALPEGDEIDP